MNPDSSVGRVMTAEEALRYYERVIEAEKALGPLTDDEKMVILSKFGTDITKDDLIGLLQGKRVLRVKGPDEKA